MAASWNCAFLRLRSLPRWSSSRTSDSDGAQPARSEPIGYQVQLLDPSGTLLAVRHGFQIQNKSPKRI